MAFVIALGFAALGTATATRAQTPGTAQKLVLGTTTDVLLTEAPILLARSLGYFAAEGIDLQITPVKGSANLLPQLAAKRVQIGLLRPRALLAARAAVGNAMPVRFFYNLVRAASWELVVPEASPIRRLEDLKGRTLGVGGLAFNQVPVLRAMLTEAGLKPAVDSKPADAKPADAKREDVAQEVVALVAVGMGAPAFRALAEGRADALDVLDIQHPALEESGVRLRPLALPPRYRDLPEDGFAAHNDMLAREPATLAGFGRAMAKGTIACDANRPACVRAFWQAYPDRAPPAGTEAAAMDEAVRRLGARLARLLAFPDGEPRLYGTYPPEAWRDLAETLSKAGQLPAPDLPLETLYTDALATAVNRIVPDAVAKAARSLR